MMPYNFPNRFHGLSDEELKNSRSRYGYNMTANIQKGTWFLMLLHILQEPMLILVIAVAVLYLLVGNYSDAIFMAGAIIGVSGISFYQANRSKRALEALEKLNEPLSTVIRNS